MTLRTCLETHVAVVLFPTAVLYLTGAMFFFTGVAIYEQSVFAGVCAVGMTWPLGALLHKA